MRVRKFDQVPLMLHAVRQYAFLLRLIAPSRRKMSTCRSASARSATGGAFFDHLFFIPARAVIGVMT
ncbi:MAG: hypothetical protein U1E36_01310 [Rickettsiales bacterium]